MVNWDIHDDMIRNLIDNHILIINATKGTIVNTQTGKTIGYQKWRDGYIRVKVLCGNKVKQFSAHRIIFIAVHKYIPLGYAIDHINRNRADNRISNLRCVTQSENCKNRRKRQKYLEEY